MEKQNVHEKEECCEKRLDDQELEQMDLCFDSASDLDDHERAALYYIAGYVAHKEKGLNKDLADKINSNESEFLDLVSRGKLTHPSEDFFDLCLYLYSFYKNTDTINCCTRLLLCFNLIHDFTRYEIITQQSVFRLLINRFSKGFAKKVSDQVILDNKKNKAIKRKRVSKLFVSKKVFGIDTIKRIVILNVILFIFLGI